MGGTKPSSQHVGKVLTSPDKPNNTYSNDNSQYSRGNDSGILYRMLPIRPMDKPKQR